MRPVSGKELAKALQEKLESDGRRRALLDYLDELDGADPPTPDEKRRAEARAKELIEKVRR